MISYRYVVERTRRVRDLLSRKKFVAVRRSPGGKDVRLGAAETRRRALKIAQHAARPNGSPTAGGSYRPGYTDNGGSSYEGDLPQIINR